MKDEIKRSRCDKLKSACMCKDCGALNRAERILLTRRAKRYLKQDLQKILRSDISDY